jgi:hypothetical protein
LTCFILLLEAMAARVLRIVVRPSQFFFAPSE